MDRFRFLDILEGYGAGARALSLLRRYWERLKMVAQAGGYFGEPFRIERFITQGNPLSPTIFNLVVEAVVFHWEYLVAEQEVGSISDDDRDVSQTAGRTIWDRDDGRGMVIPTHN